MGIKGFTSLLMETRLWSSKKRNKKNRIEEEDHDHHPPSPHKDNEEDDNDRYNNHNNYTHEYNSNEMQMGDEQTEIKPGSTFLIDGPSFAFYCHRLAYDKYYQDTLDSFYDHSNDNDGNDDNDSNNNKDPLHIVQCLLPTSMPYSYLHDVTQHVLQALASCDIQCLVFYEDGHDSHSHPFTMAAETNEWLSSSYINLESFKAMTQRHRHQQRLEAQDRLTSFLTRHVLPASFASILPRNPSSKRTQPHSPHSTFPLAYVFLQEFPLPPLLQAQVRYTIQCFSQANPNHVSIQHCLGECDRALAMLSYKDTSNKTFVLSHDSDYMFFGPLGRDDNEEEKEEIKETEETKESKEHPVAVVANQNVQYIPLDTLQIVKHSLSNTTTYYSKYCIKGTVLTRSKIARAFHVTERVLLEASIVMGNDYTASFMEQQDAQKTINFFQEFQKESNRGMIHGKNKQDILDGMAYLMEEHPLYQVTSDDPKLQKYIYFSRAWFTFEDVSCFSFNDDSDSTDNNTDTHCQNDQDLNTDQEEDNGLMLDDIATDMYDDEVPLDREHLQRRIIQTFIQRSKDKHDSSKAASIVSQLNWTELYSQPSNVLCATNINYHHHVQASRFQKCIRQVLQACSKHSYNQYVICDLNGDILYEESNDGNSVDPLQDIPISIGPSDIFHPIQFYNYMASKDDLVPNDPSVAEENVEAHLSSSSNDLPIDNHRNTILSSIVNNRITIIQGETGSGKSSKVPIMIMEEPPPDPIMKEVKMFICQPRRIAAKSLVERVRSITTEPLTSKFALRMGHGHKEYATQESRAFFVTTGYMVRYLANNMKSFNNVTHLIIDEVHERSVDSDILCLLAKRLLAMHPHLRLVLMSATVASERYREYFASTADPIFVGRRCFPIREMFLEDIGKELLFGSKEQQQIDLIEKQSLLSRCLTSPDPRYMSILHRLSVLLATSVARSGSSVLIFVPGMTDIVAITEMFEDIITATKYVILAVHSDIPFDEQMEIFGSTNNGEVRVIVATNAAESSITLPDVDHVFDFGLHKSLSYNAKSHRQRLEASWISKASAIQRMGRTGRVRPGTVYRLYPKKIFTDYMTPFDVGEILRIPLDATILNLRTILHDPISSILTQCIEPPDITNIENSFSSLFKRRFISQPDDNFQLTPIGTLVAELGLDLNLGAIISMGILLGLVPETIELAAILSCPQTPWLIPNSLLQEVDVYNDIVKRSYTSKSMFDGGNYSEAFAIMNLLWDYNQTPSSKNYQFAKEHAVSLPRLNRILSSRKNLQQRVSSHLNIPLVSLCTKRPPREMSSSTLTALRLIKTWIFHDSLITLSPIKNNINTGNFSLKLERNPVKKAQFQSILENDCFHLDSIGDIRYKGRHEATSIDHTPLMIDNKSFESRLLSLVIEKNVKVLCHRAGNWIHLYAITTNAIEKIRTVPSLNDDDIYTTDSMECYRNLSSHKGWRGRICGAWKVLWSREMSGEAEISGGDDNRINVSCQRYCLSSVLHAKRKYKELATSLQTLHRLFDIVRIEADPSITDGPIEIRHHSRTHDAYFEISELKDLFSTPHIRLQKVNETYNQEMVFENNKERNSNHAGGWFQNTQAPWEVRLLTALACTQRTSREPFVSLPNSIDDENNDNGSSFSTISFDVENLRGKWSWIETGGKAIVDSMSIPATITPQQHEVYACCGNILELKRGTVLAQNVTILPPGENFLTMAFTCYGMTPPMTSSMMEIYDDCFEFCRNGTEEIDFSQVDRECAICLSELRQPQITICRHFFCKKCIVSFLLSSNTTTPRCPYCRCKIHPKDIKDTVSKDMKDRQKNAQRFYDTLHTLMTSNEKKKSLSYSQELVNLLCNVFHNLDGLEVLPWEDSMTVEAVVHNTASVTHYESGGGNGNSNSRRSSSTVDFLLNEMGRKNVPSSFVQLLLEHDMDETMTNTNDYTMTSNDNRMERTNATNATVTSSAACNYLQSMLLQEQEGGLEEQNNDEHSTHDDVSQNNHSSVPQQRGVDLMAAVLSSRCYTMTQD